MTVLSKLGQGENRGKAVTLSRLPYLHHFSSASGPLLPPDRTTTSASDVKVFNNPIQPQKLLQKL